MKVEKWEGEVRCRIGGGRSAEKDVDALNAMRLRYEGYFDLILDMSRYSCNLYLCL